MILLSSVSISSTGPIAFGDVFSPVTAIVVVYSLVEPSALVAKIVISAPVPEVRLLLSATETKPVVASMVNAPFASLLNW